MKWRTALMYLGVIEDPDRPAKRSRLPMFPIATSAAVAIIASDTLVDGVPAKLAVSIAIEVVLVFVYALAYRLLHRPSTSGSDPS